jgi:mannose-6-phosphate isomerase
MSLATPVLTLPKSAEAVFAMIEQHLLENDFKIIDRDLKRPWGGYYVIEPAQAEIFAQRYFPGVDFASLHITDNLSPKILMVAPGHRLSWQYHFRRAEIWRLIAGSAELVTSSDDTERHHQVLKMGELIRLKQGERHRLIGTNAGWGMVAEIWQHTVPGNPSDESDIVRLQDDYRK